MSGVKALIKGRTILAQLCTEDFNPLNVELNPTCHWLALLVAHPILYISRIRVKAMGSVVVHVFILLHIILFINTRSGM